MKYLVEVSATVEIDAENVAQAVRLSREIRVLGEKIGWRSLSHNRDAIRHSMRVVKIRRGMPVSQDAEKARERT